MLRWKHSWTKGWISCWWLIWQQDIQLNFSSLLLGLVTGGEIPQARACKSWRKEMTREPLKDLEDGLPGIVSSDRITPIYFSHKARPFGRGPTTRSLGDDNDHHGPINHVTRNGMILQVEFQAGNLLPGFLGWLTTIWRASKTNGYWKVNLSSQLRELLKVPPGCCSSQKKSRWGSQPHGLSS